MWNRTIVAALALGALLPACGASLAVVGIERRSAGDTELEIVGPYASAEPCSPRRGVEDPATHAALDERCVVTGSGSHR
jgi:hypothetical protein